MLLDKNCALLCSDHAFKKFFLPQRLDHEFITSSSILEGKARILRENGIGKKPSKADSLSTEEENSPTALINSMWWLMI